jgi:16S rRNA C967 or C1407 C5-methylase (RsmB/RsmF family)/NOL1/NOP2/fmu family ribosome biogenesis protein
MLPEGFIKRIRTQKYIDAESLIKALDEPSPVSIRLNPSKWNRVPSDSEPVPWCADGYYLSKRPSFTLDPLFHAGCYYSREASGMFLEQVIMQKVPSQQGIKVLDLCGAPGGKSTHLSSLIASNGLLIANEVIGSRAAVLSENIKKWGAVNTIVTSNDPASFGKLKGYFDVVFVDAPCSGEGMFRDQTVRREWSENNARLCADRQKRILMDVWPSLSNGGILIYSTCTFNPGENEQNIRWLLEQKNGTTEKINISDYPGIIENEYQGISSYGFSPDRIRGEGFFISVIRKTEETGTIQVRSGNDKFRRIAGEDLKTAVGWTTFTEDRIVRIDNEILKLPLSRGEYEFLSRNLRIVSAGTRICSVMKKDYIPSPGLALSVGLKKEAFPMVSLNYGEAISFLCRERFLTGKVPKGWSLAGYNGVPLGFAKNIGTRINNYYPVGWRIRMKEPLTRSAELIKWK